MNDVELKDFFENIIGDSPDTTFEAQLLSSAKNEIERVLKPPFLQNVDETQTRNSGDIYTTLKSLPADFREMLMLYVGTQKYSQIPYVRRVDFRNTAHRFYIDHRQSKFGVCGTAAAAETIRQYYRIKTSDLTAALITATTPATTIVWPSEFIELCAWKAAEIYQGGTDEGADDISFRMSQSQRKRYDDLWDAFVNWIHDQKLEEQDHRGGFEPEEPDIEQDLAYM